MLGADLALSAGRPTTANGIPPSGGGGAFSQQYSLDFDGTDDYLDTGSSFSSTLQSDYTISTWFKRNETSATAWLYGHDYRVPNKNILKVYFTSTTLVFNFQIAGTSLSASFSNTPDTNWHHLVVSASQSGGSVVLKVYLDGVYKNTGSATASLSNYANPVTLTIGAGNGGTSRFSYSNAKQDEFAIFGSALSDGGVSIGQTAGGDIATLYNSGVPGNLSSLTPVAWYRMGDTGTDYGTSTITNAANAGTNDATIPNQTNGTNTSGAAFSTDIPS